MSDTHEWTEEQVAAALADLLDQPHPTTTNPALQPHLNIFQELQASIVQPSVRFEKELSRLLLDHKQKAEKMRGRESLLLRLRSYFPFRWPSSPRLAASLMILAIFLAWTFWPIRVDIPYDSIGARAMPPQVKELLDEGLPTTRFELFSTYGFNAYATTSLPDDLEYQFQPDGSGGVNVVGARPVSLLDTLNLLPVVEQPVETGITLAAALPTVVATEPTAVPALITGDVVAVNQSQTRMVQQEATLSLVVADVPATVEQITDLAFAMGGYLTNLQSGQSSNGNPRATTRLRVPAEQFFSTLDDIKELGLEVVSENITSEDVTSRYVDLNARLHNLRITETEIGDLLATAQDRGESSQEILRIYDDLTGIREEIEVLQGQIQYLEQTVAMSLISVNLVTEPEELEEEELKPDPFSASETAKEAWVNLVNIWQGIATLLIWLGVHSPFILLPLGLVWFIRRRNTLRRLQSKQ